MNVTGVATMDIAAFKKMKRTQKTDDDKLNAKHCQTQRQEKILTNFFKPFLQHEFIELLSFILVTRPGAVAV